MIRVWDKSPKSGNWKQVFGELAPESFGAWLVSNYVNTVAAAGKHEYPLPMYVNVWLIEGVERAGRWPSGGATVNVFDIWKAAAPAIDILAPDIYYPKFYDVAGAVQPGRITHSSFRRRISILTLWALPTPRSATSTGSASALSGLTMSEKGHDRCCDRRAS